MRLEVDVAYLKSRRFEADYGCLTSRYPKKFTFNRQESALKSFSPQVKFEIISKYLKGGISVYAICREYGISKVTFYQWLSLYKNSRKDRTQAFDRKIRSGKFHPKALNSAQRLAVLRLVHSHPEYSCHTISEVLALGNHGVENFLLKGGLNKYEDRLAFSKKPFWKRDSAERREAMFNLLEKGWTITDICSHFNISKPIFYKWKKRWEEAREGEKLAALADRYITGETHHNYIKEGNKQQVVELVKTNPELSVHKLHQHLAGVVGHKTIQNILARENLNTYEKRLRFAQGYTGQPKIQTAPLYIPDIPLYKLRHLIAHFATVPKLLVTDPKRGLPRAFAYFSTLVLLFLWIRLLFTTPYATPLGLFFASIALFFGLFFFIYSMKYYITVLLVLKLAQSGGGLGRLGMLGKLGVKLFGLKQKEQGRVNPLTLNLDKITLRTHPFVSIHVALYNEKRVVERLIRACEAQEYFEETSTTGNQGTTSTTGIDEKARTFRDNENKLSYTRDTLTTRDTRANYELIIADDSTDGTTEMAKTLLSSEGRILDIVRRDEEMEVYVSSPPVGSSLPVIKLIHRFSRSGFKGAALQRALENTNPRAVYISVFDADFVPYPDTIEQFVKTFQELNSSITSGQGTTSTTGSDEMVRDTRDTLNARGTSNIAAVQGYPEEFLSLARSTSSPRDVGSTGQANGTNSMIAAVQGYQWHVLNKSQTWITRGVRTEYAGSYVIERAGEEIYGGLKQIAGSVYAIRADVLRQFGWGTSITEDFELTLRLYERGYKVAFTPYIQAPAEAVSTIKRLVRQRMRWAEGASYNIKVMLPRLLFGHWEAIPQPVIANSTSGVVSPTSVIARNEVTKQSDEEIATSLDELGTRNDNESGDGTQGRVWRPSGLTRTEKLEFAYLAPYYLQAAFFVIGTFSWFISEAILGSRLPFWTAALGWSLVFTNILALPLMNIVGLFLEESDERDYIGILSFIVLSYIVVPFQAYAAIKGFLEKKEGPWFRTPKTGLITDTFTKITFGKYFRNLLGAGTQNTGSMYQTAGNAAFPLTAQSFANPYLALTTANNQFDSFTKAGGVPKSKGSRIVVRAALAFCFAVIFLTINLVQLEESGKHNVNFFSVLDLSAQRGEKLVSGKKNYTYSEKPTFTLKVNDQIMSSSKKGKLPFLSFGDSDVYAQEGGVQAKVTYRDTLVETKANVTREYNGQYQIQIERPQQFRPGKYTLEAEYKDQKFNQDFRWGVVAMNTTKSVYTAGEVVKFNFGVVDDLGRTICNAKLRLVIFVPSESKNYTLSSENGLIQKNPGCSPKQATNTPDYAATFKAKNTEEIYQLHLEAETYNGKREIDDELIIVKEVPFEVERADYPTRIYPMALYPVSITIEPNTDFEGEIRDFLPADFGVLDVSDYGVFSNQSIVWRVKWQKDQTYSLKYVIAFPKISPAFYQIGPLTFLPSASISPIFAEARKWQIAADAATNIQRVDATAASGSTTVAPTLAAATAGNLLVTACAIDKNSGTITIPDGFTRIGTDYVQTDVSYSYAYKIAAGGETAITWNWTTGASATAWAGEYSGIASSPLDQNQRNTSDTTAVTSLSTGTTGTTSQTDELAIAFMASDTWSNTETGRAWTNSFSEVSFSTAASGSRPGLSVAEKNLTATGTVETTFSTTDTGDQMVAVVATFKETVIPENWVLILLGSPFLLVGLRYLKRRRLQ